MFDLGHQMCGHLLGWILDLPKYWPVLSEKSEGQLIQVDLHQGSFPASVSLCPRPHYTNLIMGHTTFTGIAYPFQRH